MRAILAALLAFPSRSRAARADDTTNSANNPLTAETSLNLQNYYTPSFYGPLNSDANSLLLRGLVPLLSPGAAACSLHSALFGQPERRIAMRTGSATSRCSILSCCRPNRSCSRWDPCSWRRRRPIASPAPGAGRRPRPAPPFPCRPWPLAGALCTHHEQSVRRDRFLLLSRPVCSPRNRSFLLPAARFSIFSLSGVWNFDFQNNLGYIPVGLGAGKVVQIGKVTANFFVEPQYTVYHYGEQVPHWQIYAGMNFQF